MDETSELGDAWSGRVACTLPCAGDIIEIQRQKRAKLADSDKADCVERGIYRCGLVLPDSKAGNALIAVISESVRRRMRKRQQLHRQKDGQQQ